MMSNENQSSPLIQATKSQNLSNTAEGNDRSHFLVDLLNPDAEKSNKELSKVIQRFKICHERCSTSIKQSLRHAIECGRNADLLRSHCGHGQWTKRFELELLPQLGVSLRTVERYINVYQQFQKFVAQSGASLNLDDEDVHTAKLLSQFQLEDKRKSNVPSVSPNDWVTPNELMAFVLRFLQKVDCDPCVEASQRPTNDKIAISYSKEDGEEGGLSDELPWSGRCWIAPGHKGEFGRWVQKAVRELKLGEMKEALLMLPSQCLSNSELLSFDFVALSQPLTIPVKGKKGTRLQVIRDRMLIHYLSLSPDPERFLNVFGSLGTVYSNHFNMQLSSNKQ